MTITKELLEERLASFRDQLEQAIAQVHGLKGAIAVTEWLLTKEAEPAPEPEPEPPRAVDVPVSREAALEAQIQAMRTGTYVPGPLPTPTDGNTACPAPTTNPES